MKAARSRIFSRCNRLAAALAVAAVLLRCAIVPGLMLDPVAAAQGELKLVICTSAGAKAIDARGDRESPPRQQGDGELCPYAAPGHVGTPADPVMVSGERLQPAFAAQMRDAAPRPALMRSFAARAPPKLT